MPLIAAGALAAGCGGPPYEDLLGVWQVTAHTENTTGCDVEGPAVAEPPYIKFVEGELFGQEYAEYVACTDPATCDEPGGLFFSLLYAEEISGGVRAVIYGASHGGDPNDCLLSGTISNATITAGALRIETTHKSEEHVSGTACDSDDAKARWDTMPCTGYEVIAGVRAQ
jgi:hypothetical protein